MAVSGNGGVRVQIAFNADTLTAAPTWTGLHTFDGVRVGQIDIKRGRPNERDKIGVGTVTVTGTDRGGTLDPTNAGGELYGKLNPVKQARVQLWNPVSDTWHTLFRGFVGGWRYDVDSAKSRLAWTLELGDALDILADAEVVPDQAGHTVPAESAGDVYYVAQEVDDRIRAAIADSATALLAQAWPPELLEIFSGNVTVQGVVYSARTSLLQVIEDAADAEFPGAANFYADRNGVLTFHGRFARFNPEDAHYHIAHWKAGDEIAFETDHATAVMTSVAFDRTKDNLINAALATPKDIKDADIAGQFVSDATSVSKYAPRSVSFDSLITDYGHPPGGVGDQIERLDAVKQFATYYVDNFKTPVSRIGQLPFVTKRPGDPRGPAVWNLLTNVDISDLVSVRTHHPGGGGIDADYFVEGVNYQIRPMNGDYAHVVLMCDVSPRARYDTDPFGGS